MKTIFLMLLFWTMHTWAVMGKVREKRAWIIDSFSIEEENPGPFPYILGKIELDRKYLVNFLLYGQGVDEEPKNVLSIVKDTGEIFVHGKVDYESIADSHKALKLRFEALNRSNNEVDTRLGVEIKILDINDNAPEFLNNYEVTVDELHVQGKEVTAVLASDKDDSKTPNGTFSLTIKSVTPKTDNVEFYIQQTERAGNIYFKGCLDYEKAQKYKIVVEAKDHGEKIQLSSSSTVTVIISDNNNHLPEFSSQAVTGKIKEREVGTEVLRLQVTDKDSRGSNAWKAKYKIHEDPKNIFHIETDPNTNEGVLTIVKPMDYEEQTQLNMSISVQNESPYFSCKVKSKPRDALWELDRFSENPGTNYPKLYKKIPVTIYVEDVNDPPVFIPPVKDVSIKENTEVGTYLTTITAKDSDGAHGNTFKYVKGEDVAEWITIDEKTGQVSIAKYMDRESEFVKNSTYSVTVYAVDDGEPPLTGTGTIRIHVQDQNDNVPQLTVDHVNMCLDKEPTIVNITATDRDLPPYTSPFYYELLGDVKGIWKIDPASGTTVNLVKESNIYSGHYFLQMRISDQQGFSSVQNLSVTVCNCVSNSNCREKMVSKTQMGIGGVWIILLSVLFLAVILLLAFLLTCKTEIKMIPIEEGLGHLITTNAEIPGTDCMLPFNGGEQKNLFSKEIKVSKVYLDEHDASQFMTNYGQQAASQIQNSAYSNQNFQRTIYRNSSRRSYRGMKNYQRSSFRSTSSYQNASFKRDQLFSIINQQLLAVQTRDEDHDAYEPHCYAHEGEFIPDADLDAISIPDTDFIPETLNNLDRKFNSLATVCRPAQMKTMTDL